MQFFQVHDQGLFHYYNIFGSKEGCGERNREALHPYLEASGIYATAVNEALLQSHDGTIRLWPMPEGRPFHTLPYDELLTRLRSFTNLRVVDDKDADRFLNLVLDSGINFIDNKALDETPANVSAEVGMKQDRKAINPPANNH